MQIPDHGILTGLPLFRNADPAPLAELFPRFSWRDLATGDALLRPGEINTTLFVLLSGQLRVHLENADDAPTVTLGPGETVGEISILDGNPVSALVTANEPSRLLTIDQDTLWNLIDRSGDVARNLLHLLSGRLRHNNELITAAYRHSRDLEDKVHQDPLTGLLNRRGLETMLERLILQCSADGTALTLLVIDVDHFKSLNDLHGHDAGDRVLAALARSVRENLRPSDLAARYGGDELVVGLIHTHAPQAHLVAERIRSATSDIRLNTSEGAPIPTPTLSIGLAELAPGHDAQSLFRAADDALYRAKSQGRNRVAA